MKKFDFELSFDETFDQNYSMMVKRCKGKIGPNDAEDLVIEAFTLLYEKWDSFDNHREKVLTVWLYKTLDNKCSEYLRKKRRTELLSENLIICDKEDIDASAEYEKYGNYVEEIKKSLTPAEKELFDCIICKEMSPKETEEYLKISGVALRVRWFRTKKHISMFLPEIIND